MEKRNRCSEADRKEEEAAASVDEVRIFAPVPGILILVQRKGVKNLSHAIQTHRQREVLQTVHIEQKSKKEAKIQQSLEFRRSRSKTLRTGFSCMTPAHMFCTEMLPHVRLMTSVFSPFLVNRCTILLVIKSTANVSTTDTCRCCRATVEAGNRLCQTMFSHLLVLGLVCVAFPSSESKLVWRSSNDLFYFKHQKLSYNETLTTCSDLGGRVPTATSRPDSEYLAKHSGSEMWLFASKDRGGYRWSDSMQFIDSNLWAPYEPDCSGSCAAIVRNGQLYAVPTDTAIPYACQFDISSDIQLQKVVDHWKGFESVDQQQLVEYVLKRKMQSSSSTAVSDATDLTQLSSSLRKLNDMVSSTNQEVKELRQENKKTISSFREALQVSLTSLDSKSNANYTDALSKLFAS